jgi:hypothetical protein
MANDTKQEIKTQPAAFSPIDGLTRRLIRVCASLALTAAMIFFTYSAFAGTVLGGGSTKVFTGVACLLLVLISCIMIEKIVLKNTSKETTGLDVE